MTRSLTRFSVKAQLFFREHKKELKVALVITIATLLLLDVLASTIYATDLFGAADTMSKSLRQQITTTYCDSLFPLICIVDLVWLAFTHNDKTQGKLVTALKWAVGAYCLLKGFDWVKTTIDNTLNLNATSTP